MIRFIVQAHEVDELGLDRKDFHTIDAEVPTLEAALMRGGRGGFGFNSWTLVGAEVLPKPAREGAEVDDA